MDPVSSIWRISRMNGSVDDMIDSAKVMALTLCIAGATLTR